MGFLFNNTSVQTSLINELDIMHRDFLGSAEQIIEAEIAGDKYYSELNKQQHSEHPDLLTWRSEMIKENQNLYDHVKSKWKTNTQIRATSSKVFESIIPESPHFISEAAKIKFIKNRQFERHFNLSLLFKYFSQYQHFSPKMHQFLLTTPENDLLYYYKTLVEFLCIAGSCNQVILTSDRELNKGLLENAIIEIFKLMNTFDEIVPPTV